MFRNGGGNCNQNTPVRLGCTSTLVQEKLFCFLFSFPQSVHPVTKNAPIVLRLVQSEKDTQRKISFFNRLICHTAEPEYERRK